MPERDGPLRTLGTRLRKLGPPSLSVIIALLQDAEDYRDFINLVREFLPDYEREILNKSTPSLQVTAFCSRFQDRYFPLEEFYAHGMAEGYSDVTRRIPVVCLGLSWEDYHEMEQFRDGLQLMTYLLEAPEGQEDEARIAIGEMCTEHISPDILQRVPEGGFPRDEVHRLLKGTRYEALVLWADTLEWDTGNFFIDTTSEELWQSPLDPSWDREIIENLTREWARAEQIQEEIGNLAEWLEKRPQAHFEELLNFMLERREREDESGGGQVDS